MTPPPSISPINHRHLDRSAERAVERPAVSPASPTRPYEDPYHQSPTPMESTTRDARPFAFTLAALVILADRLSKLWIKAHIQTGDARPVIPGVFRLTHVLNTGAAFSLFEGARSPATVRYVLIAVACIEITVVLAFLIRTGRRLTSTTVGFALILGGALGNLYDRVHLHYVIDFLEVRIIHYHWPDFNIADSSIVIGACLLMLEVLRPQPTPSTAA